MKQSALVRFGGSFAAYAVYTGIALILFVAVGMFDIRREHFMFFTVIVSLTMLSLFDFVDEHLYRYAWDRYEHRQYAGLIDSMLGIRTLDEFLEDGLQHLALLFGVQEVSVFLLNKRTDEFTAYTRRGGRTRRQNTVPFDTDSAIVRMMNSPEDVIVRRRINPQLSIESALVAEMDAARAALAIPVFYKGIFLGIVCIAGEHRNYSHDELSTARIFAAKLGSLHANLFLVREIVHHRELERERDTALRVRRSFFSKHEVKNSSCDVSISAHSGGLISDLFYDLHLDGDRIICSAYSSGRGGYDSLVFMPAVKVLLQSFLRMGRSLDDAVDRTLAVLNERALIDEQFSMMAGIVDGATVQYRMVNNHPPILYRHGVAVADEALHSASGSVALVAGDVMVLAGRELADSMREKSVKVASIIHEGEHRRTRHTAERLFDLIRPDTREDNRIVLVIRCV